MVAIRHAAFPLTVFPPAVLLLAVLLAAPPASAEPPLDYQPPPPDPPAAGKLARPSPGQLPGTVAPPLVGPGPFRNLPAIDDNQPIIAGVRNQPYWKAGRRDPVLTNACRQGQFSTVPSNTLVVRFTAAEGTAALRVVPANLRHLLIDTRRLARPGEVYYFRDAGMPSCEVLVQGRGPLRQLDKDRGTSLPKTDPHALDKRKALIDSWR